MAAPTKYPDELRDRAVRMVMDLRRDPLTPRGALARVGQQLGINIATCAIGFVLSCTTRTAPSRNSASNLLRFLA